MPITLGLDLGTTSIKAAALDVETGRLARVAARPTPVDHPQPGYSEHEPEALWRTVTECLREARAGCPDDEVLGLAIGSFAEAGVPLDAAGRPLHPFIAWYDRRCEVQAAWWEGQIGARELHAITGQRVSPSFGVNKYLWLREHRPHVAKHMATWLSAPDYILWRLCGEQVTDYSMASRTLLFDQRTRDWSPEMLRRAALSTAQLPRLRPAGSLVGPITRAAVEATGLPPGTRCVVGGHDHLCAAFATGGYRPGTVIDSCGTAEATLVVLPQFHTGERAAAGGYACYAHVVEGQYVLKAGLKLAGGALEWLARQLAGPAADASSGEGALPYAALEREAAAGIGRQAGPLWLPHLIGSGTPEGDRHSLAALVGARAEHGRGDLYRGMLESLAFWLRHNLEEIAQLTAQPAEEVILIGGTVRGGLLAQLKADVLGQAVLVPDLPEATVAGAALLAGLGAGRFAGPAEAAATLRYAREVVTPDAARVAWYDRIYHTAYRPLYDALAGVNHTLASIIADTREGEGL